MEIVRFRIRHADGRVEELVTESAHVLIGSGRHCEIRLSPEEARLEHVLVEATPAGLRASARSFDPPPTLDGMEFTEAPVPGEAVLAVGTAHIEVSRGGPGAAGDLARRAGSRRNPRAYAYPAVGLIAWAAMLSARRPRTAGLTEPAKVPALFDASPAACPRQGAEEAAAVARERLGLAVAKQERSPFHPEDGVAALPLYLTAEACFRAAGDAEDADDAAASADRLKRDVTEQFRFHRVRLERSLALKEWSPAERETRILLSFLPGGGEYASWLSNVRRKLQLTYLSKKEP